MEVTVELPDFSHYLPYFLGGDKQVVALVVGKHNFSRLIVDDFDITEGLEQAGFVIKHADGSIGNSDSGGDGVSGAGGNGVSGHGMYHPFLIVTILYHTFFILSIDFMKVLLDEDSSK
jgi:hypothetical protein